MMEKQRKGMRINPLRGIETETTEGNAMTIDEETEATERERK